MFDIDCHVCGSTHLVGSRSILSVHNTSEGVIAYARCPNGHTVVVDFAAINPYDWRNSARRPVVEEPLAA